MLTIQPVLSVYNSICKRHRPLNYLVGDLKDVFSAASAFIRFPTAFHKANAVGGIFCGADLFFAPVRLAIAAKNIVKEKAPTKKLLHSLEVVKETATIALDTLAIVSALKTFGQLSSRALTWVSPVCAYLLPITFVVLPFYVADAVSVNALRNKIQAVFKRPEKLSSLDKRVANISRSLLFVKKNGKQLCEQLSFSKKFELQKKANSLLSQVKQGSVDALEQAETLMSTLRSRARVVTALDTLTVIVQVATLALAVASIAVSVAAPPAVPALLIAAGISSIALFVLKTIMVEKNPGKPDTWYKKLRFTLQQDVSFIGYYAYKALKLPVKAAKQRRCCINHH